MIKHRSYFESYGNLETVRNKYNVFIGKLWRISRVIYVKLKYVRCMHFSVLKTLTVKYYEIYFFIKWIHLQINIWTRNPTYLDIVTYALRPSLQTLFILTLYVCFDLTALGFTPLVSTTHTFHHRFLEKWHQWFSNLDKYDVYKVCSQDHFKWNGSCLWYGHFVNVICSGFIILLSSHLTQVSPMAITFLAILYMYYIGDLNAMREGVETPAPHWQ